MTIDPARLRRAKMHLASEAAEDIDYHTTWGMDRAVVARLLRGEWIRERQNVYSSRRPVSGKGNLNERWPVSCVWKDSRRVTCARRLSTRRWPFPIAVAATRSARPVGEAGYPPDERAGEGAAGT